MGLRDLSLRGNYFPALELISKGFRFHSTGSGKPFDLKKLRPMILNRIEERSKDYPVKGLLPVANEVLQSRATLYDGVSTLIRHIPVWSCKYCPEVFIGDVGHQIKTCHGYRHHAKNKIHNWIKGSINDVIIPVETFHLKKMFQDVIKHDERFDYDRIPAVVELCLQAGVDSKNHYASPPSDPGEDTPGHEPLSEDELRLVATRTLRAWETLRSGVGKLLLVYPSRACKHCSEVHVGPSGHKSRTCGVFKYETWRGTHFWEKARVDHLVPPNIVWFRRRHDPTVLVDNGREYYGHAPAVVDLCSKGGALVPSKYFYMMKPDGLTAPV